MKRTELMKTKKAAIVEMCREAGLAVVNTAAVEQVTKAELIEMLMKAQAEADQTVDSAEQTVDSAEQTVDSAEQTAGAEKKTEKREAYKDRLLREVIVAVATVAAQGVDLTYKVNKKGQVLLQMAGKTVCKLHAIKAGVYVFPASKMKAALDDVTWTHHAGWACEYETTVKDADEAVALVRRALAKPAQTADAEGAEQTAGAEQTEGAEA